MGVLSSILTPLNGLLRPSVEFTEWSQATPAQQYRELQAYYENNALYDALVRGMRELGVSREAMKPLRNPANRVVEFYAAKLWPGPLPEALPLETEHEAIVEPIHRVWTWSNWSAKKQVAARWLSLYGDLFIKVVGERRVWFELIEPEFVTEFETDERGYLTFCRIDIPQAPEGDNRPLTHTEVWEKERLRIWRHAHPADTPLSRLGAPQEERPTTDFGIDFVPIVHVKFRDVGKDRGVGAFTHCIDKIDEANRMATRLHQMMFRFNRPLMVLGSAGVDANGRPLPPPKLGDAQSGAATDIGDDTWFRLPGLASLEALVPNLNYESFRKVLEDHMGELEKDMPELAYYRLREMNQISGVAVRALLSDAIDRVLEARGNAEAGLIRANQMALTIGAHLKLFETEGSYDSGAFEHAFTARPVIPLSETEEAAAELQQAQTLVVKRELGISARQALRELDYAEDEIEKFEQENAEGTETAGAALLRNLDRGAEA